MKRHVRARGLLLRRRVTIGTAVGLLFVLSVQAVFQPFVHWEDAEKGCPGQKVSISGILEKKEWSKQDYAVLYRQTGLGKQALEQLRSDQNYEKEAILAFQDAFLAERETQCFRTSFFTRQDRALSDSEKPVLLAPLEDGDIFLSFSSHSLGWRHGHAGLLVDAGRGLCLEARMPGCCSDIKSAEHWKNCSSFIILRLKDASGAERQEIARYARENLKGIPYSLTSGLSKSSRGGDCRGLTAQCAYLIWYAYEQFGYDLDSDGGKIVTVRDLLDSPDLEVVQSAGTLVDRQGD